MDIAARLQQLYPAIFRPEHAEAHRPLLDMLLAFSTTWSPYTRGCVDAILSNDPGGAALAEVRVFGNAMASVMYPIHNMWPVKATVVRDFAQHLVPGDHQINSNLVALCRVLDRVCESYIHARWHDVPPCTYGVQYSMWIDTNRNARRVVLEWQPFTRKHYKDVSKLLTAIFSTQRFCVRLRRGANDAVHGHHPETIAMSDTPAPDPANPRPDDWWMLEYPTAHNIDRARRQMRRIHAILPVQTLELRRALAAACGAINYEFESHEYMNDRFLHNNITPWPPAVQRPEGGLPWRAGEATSRHGSDEPGPWDALYVLRGFGFVPINSAGTDHRWMLVHHARIMLVERELLRRYIEAAQVANNYHAFASALHPRLGSESSVRSLSVENLEQIAPHLVLTRFRNAFMVDVFGELQNQDDGAWGS